MPGKFCDRLSTASAKQHRPNGKQRGSFNTKGKNKYIEGIIFVAIKHVQVNFKSKVDNKRSLITSVKT